MLSIYPTSVTESIDPLVSRTSVDGCNNCRPWDQGWHSFPCAANFHHQAMDFFQGLQIVACIYVQQTACHVVIKFIQVGSQIATLFKVQGTLQTQHNAAGAGNGF